MPLSDSAHSVARALMAVPFLLLISVLVSCSCGTLSESRDAVDSGDSIEDASSKPTEVYIYYRGPVNLTGNEVLSRALPGFGAATVTRTRQMASALSKVMAYWPNEEWKNQRSKLRLEDSNQVASVAWPIDHPLLPWRGIVESPPAIVPILTEERTIENEEGSIKNEKGNIRLEIVFELADQDTFRVLVRQIDTSGSEINVCKKRLKAQDVIKDERGVVLREVVDFVASCSLSTYLQKEKAQFAAVYDLLLSASDTERLAALIRGIEHYSNFILATDKATESSTLDLELAIGEFTSAADGNGPGRSFAKYLLVHASTTVHGYDLPRIPKHQHTYISNTIDDVFNIEPFKHSSALWTKALAYEKHRGAVEAREAWEKLQSGDAIRQASDAQVKILVRRANLYRRQEDFAEAIRQRQELTVFMEQQEATPKARAGSALEEGIDNLILYTLTKNLSQEARLHRGIAAFMNKTHRKVFQTLAELQEVYGSDMTETVPKLDAAEVFSCEDHDTCTELRNHATNVLSAASNFFYDQTMENLRQAYWHLRSEIRIECHLAMMSSTSAITSESCVAANIPSVLDAKPDSETQGTLERLLIIWERVQDMADRSLEITNGSDSPLTEEELDQLDSLIASIAAVLAATSCEGGSVQDGLEIAQEYSARGRHRTSFAATLARCRLGLLLPEGPEQRPAFVGWVFSPPSPKDAGAAEEDLKLSITDGDPSALAALVLLEYAELWPGLDRYFTWHQKRDDTNRDIVAKVKSLRRHVRARSCDQFCLESSLNDLWSIFFRSELEHLLGDVDELWYDFLRRDTNLKDNGDGGDADQEYGRYVKLVEQYDKARDGYRQWSSRHLAGLSSRAERTRFIREAEKRVMHARNLVQAEMSSRMAEILKGFFTRYSQSSVLLSGDKGEGGVAKLALFRVFDRVEKLDDIVRQAVLPVAYGEKKKSLQVLVDEAISAVISNSMNPAHIAGMSIPLGRVLAHRSQNSQAFTLKTQGRKRPVTLHKRNRAVGAVEAAGGTCRSGHEAPEQGASVCVERFLAYVALNPNLYDYSNDASDLMREESADFLDSFDTWSRNDPQPENLAVALWWLMQDDQEKGIETKKLTSTSNFLRYVAAAAYFFSEHPREALVFLRALPKDYRRLMEVQLLEARSLVMMGKGRVALKKAMAAQEMMKESSGIIYDATLNVTKGEALLIRADKLARRRSPRARMMSQIFYQTALQSLDEASRRDVLDDDTKSRLVLNQAAALIELHQYKMALELAKSSKNSDLRLQAALIAALAHWGRGERERAVEMANGTGQIVTDLRQSGLYLGPHARSMGRRILRSMWR